MRHAGRSIGCALALAALACSGCEKQAAADKGEASFACDDHARQLGGSALTPLETTPSGDRDGECYRQMAISLSGNGRWFGTFAGPVATEPAWTAFLRGEETMANGLTIEIEGLEGDGVFTIVPPENGLLEAGQAQVVLDLDGAIELATLPTAFTVDLAAVSGQIEVTGFAEAEYGPPLMRAKIDATFQTWANGAPEGEPIQLTTTLEVME